MKLDLGPQVIVFLQLLLLSAVETSLVSFGLLVSLLELLYFFLHDLLALFPFSFLLFHLFFHVFEVLFVLLNQKFLLRV